MTGREKLARSLVTMARTSGLVLDVSADTIVVAGRDTDQDWAGWADTFREVAHEVRALLRWEELGDRMLLESDAEVGPYLPAVETLCDRDPEWADLWVESVSQVRDAYELRDSSMFDDILAGRLALAKRMIAELGRLVREEVDGVDE